MVRRIEAYGWAFVAGLLIALAVPWFLWGDGRVAFGLPLWLWWHVGWMGLAAVTFHAFARRAWGVGIETAGTEPTGPDTRSEGRAGTGGEA